MNKKELKIYLEERDISEQQFRNDMLKIFIRLNTLQLYKVYIKTLKDNPKFTADLMIEAGVGIKNINGIPSIDEEYFESLDSGIMEKVKNQKEKGD